jgi:hypothetical protein
VVEQRPPKRTRNPRKPKRARASPFPLELAEHLDGLSADERERRRGRAGELMLAWRLGYAHALSLYVLGVPTPTEAQRLFGVP